MINKLNKLAIALMVAGATATATTALARTTNTFTNAVQTLTINLKMYTNSPAGHNKVVDFTTKNLISALSNDLVNLPTLSNAAAATFTKNPTIVVSTTYGSALVPSSTNASSTNSMTNSVITTNVNFVAVSVATNIVSLSASNAPDATFANSTGFPTNGTELIAANTNGGALITNTLVVITNVSTNYLTNSMVNGTNTTVMVTTNVETNTLIGTNLVLIATNGWTGTNIANSNDVITNNSTNVVFYYVGTNGSTNASTILTNTPGTNFGFFVQVSASNYTTTNFGFGTNTIVTNLTFITMSNSTATITNTNTVTNIVYVTNYTTNYTTNVTVTDVGLEVQGGASTNYSYASLDSLLGMSNILSVVISSNATSELEDQYDKFTIGVFSTNSTNNVSLKLGGFVQLNSKDDVLSTSHGTKTEVPDDTYTATVTGYGYIGGTYSTNAYSATNSTSFALPGDTTVTNGSIIGATPVVIEGTISLGSPKNLGQH